MTPPHIEKAARAMKRAEIKKTVGLLSPASIDAHVDASWKTCIPAATLVWSLARAAALEEAAKAQDNSEAAMLQEKETCDKHLEADPTDAFWISLSHDWNVRALTYAKAARLIRALAVEG